MEMRTADQDLWMILAIIQPFKLDSVTLALEGLPAFGGVTVSDCRGFGHGKQAAERAEPFSEAQVVDFKPKIRLDIAVAGSEAADRIIETIARAAHTGRPGDGKIFAWPLRRAVRVRTLDETGATL